MKEEPDPEAGTLASGEPRAKDRKAIDMLEIGLREKPGDSIDRYKLLQKIGEGGGGVVYLAQQTEPVKRRVALKVIKLGMDTRQVVARFEAERQALAMMDHPSIAKVLDGGATASGRPYFVMELVRGVTITKFCDENKLSTKERLALFMQVCEAVQHAHQKGIIHRDLKPGNVLVTMLEDRPMPKVIDFGVAKATQQELTGKTLFTQHGYFIGTPAYMSPEQASLTGYDIDTRSDIYALGVLLYELLTGKTPFDSTTFLKAGYDEIRRVIAEDEPPKPSTRISTMDLGEMTTLARCHHAEPQRLSRLVRGDLDWIVMKALEKDRRRRYDTASGLALDIQRHLADETVSAGAPTTGYRLKKFVRRNRRGLLSGATAAVALLIGLAVAGVFWLNERERVTKVEEQAGTLIGQAEDLMETNATAEDYDDDEAFRRAEALVEQLTLLADLDEAGGEIRERRQRLVAAVESERRDRDLILGIEEARMMTMGTGGVGTVRETSVDAEKGFAEAFARHGTHPAEAPVEETINWLNPKRDEVRNRILLGMLHWAMLLSERSPEGSEQLEAVVVRALNPDPWFRKLCRAIVEKDHAVLEELAESEQVSRQPMMMMGLPEEMPRSAAETLLRQIQRKHPANFWTNFTLGHFLLRVNRLDPDYDWDLFDHSVRPEFDESIGFLRAAVAARPDAVTGSMILSLALSERGNLNDAITSARHAVELAPDWSLMHFSLGVALSKQGKLDEAITSFRRSIELDPADSDGHNTLGNVLFKQGKLDEAIRCFRRAIERDPHHAKAHSNLGGALVESGQPEEAIAALRKAIDLDQDSAGAHSNLGAAFVKAGQPEEAIAPFRKASELDRESAGAYHNLGLALAAADRFDEATAPFRKAIELDPADSMAHYNLGLALEKQDKLDLAIESLQEAIRLDPGYAPAHYRLGVALGKLDKLDQAIESLQEASRLDPDFAPVHNELGTALGQQGELHQAIESIRTAIRLNPRNAAAHKNLGTTLQKQGKLDQAIESYQEAIKLDPDDARVHNNLGTALGQQGELHQEIESYQKAVKLDPDDAVARHNLSFALAFSGQFGAARAALEAGRNPADPEGVKAFWKKRLTLLLEHESQLIDTLRKKGAGDPVVPAQLRRTSGAFPFGRPVEHLLRTFWREHREEVLRELEERTVTVVRVAKDDGAQKIAAEIRERLQNGAGHDEVAKEFELRANVGKREGEGRAEFPGELHEAVFGTAVGQVSDIVDALGQLFVVKVHDSQAGKAERFEDEGVEDAAMSAFERHRREEWEKRYLEHLQKRDAENNSGRNRGNEQ